MKSQEVAFTVDPQAGGVEQEPNDLTSQAQLLAGPRFVVAGTLRRQPDSRLPDDPDNFKVQLPANAKLTVQMLTDDVPDNNGVFKDRVSLYDLNVEALDGVSTQKDGHSITVTYQNGNAAKDVLVLVRTSRTSLTAPRGVYKLSGQVSLP